MQRRSQGTCSAAHGEVDSSGYGCDDQGLREIGLAETSLQLSEGFVLVGHEPGEVDERSTLSAVPATVATAQPYEWPTSTTGVSIVARTADSWAASAFSERFGTAGATTDIPAASRSGMTGP